jgi:hypothetical protein
MSANAELWRGDRRRMATSKTKGRVQGKAVMNWRRRPSVDPIYGETLERLCVQRAIRPGDGQRFG